MMSTECNMLKNLQTFRNMEKRARDRMERARSDAEYESNLFIAQYAAEQIDAMLYQGAK